MSLSIIIPVYNTQEYLYKCFEPFQKSVDGNIEVIFVNDGSTDNSSEILNEFEQEYDFVKVINQENQGLSGARNTGIKNASGKYFILLDSDDWLERETILKIYNLAVQKDLDLVGFRLQFVDEEGKITGISEKHPLAYENKITGAEALIEGYQPSSACLFMYKTSFIINTNLEFYRGIMQEDVEFTVRLLLHADKVLFTDKIGYNYYKRSDSMTTTLSKERIERYLSDSILVANQIRNNKQFIEQEATINAIEKNYNSVVWNLLWRFLVKPKETNFFFKEQCLKELKAKKLYPIKGDLKTSFQSKVRFFLNSETLFKFILKIRN